MKKVADKSVVCHKMNYPCAVFYCHTFTKTRTYMIPLVGADGSKSKAMAACHSDTSAWHPQHVAFQVLKIKPGTVPVCHFLHNNAMVWIPKINAGSRINVCSVQLMLCIHQCFQMLSIVIANGLKEMIDGSQPSPPIFLENSQSTNPDFRIWQRHSRFVMCWIYSSLIENVMSQIIDLTSASEIWSALEKFFFAALTVIHQLLKSLT
ncbi:hypothetical protein AAG906_002588 [Vitis piasezkii]